MHKELTIVLPSYKSRVLIIEHINNLSKKFKFIIIDNSYDKKLKKELESKYYMFLVRRQPMVLEKGEGARVWDVDG